MRTQSRVRDVTVATAVKIKLATEVNGDTLVMDEIGADTGTEIGAAFGAAVGSGVGGVTGGRIWPLIAGGSALFGSTTVFMKRSERLVSKVEHENH
jgi:hypothetical protein